MTIERTSGGTIERTYEIVDLTSPAPLSEENYQIERVKLLIREAQDAGNTTYAQIRQYLLNRAFVE